MAKKSGRTNVSPLARENAALAAQNKLLSQRSSLLQSTIENSLGGLMSGLGAGGPQSNLTSMNPMLQNNIYSPVTLMWQALMFMYKTHGLIQTAIDQPVLDAVRGGLDLHSDEMDAEDLGKLEDYLEEHGILDRIVDAFIWARLFGGGAIVINTEADSKEPLGDEVKGGKIELYDACRWELNSERRLPKSGLYGFYGQQVHESKVITVMGKRAPYLIRAQLSDWGMSEIERMLEDFNSYIRGKNVVYELLEEAKVDIYNLKGFTSQLATANGTSLTTKRIQTMNQIKNFSNALILDKDDTYDQKTLSFGGLAEILKENRIGIASALRMPISKLFGMGATGLNAGQDDIENYNSMVESEIRQPMKPLIRKVLKLVVMNLFGEDLDINFKFKSLRILGAVDEESIKTSKSTRYLALYDKMLMDSKEVGEACQKDNLVPIALKAEKGLLEEHPTPAEGQTQGGAPLNEQPEETPPAGADSTAPKISVKKADIDVKEEPQAKDAPDIKVKEPKAKDPEDEKSEVKSPAIKVLK